jgi:hypothetical protein
MMQVDREQLGRWCAKALCANMTYHVERQRVWKQLLLLVQEEKTDDTVEMPLRTFSQLKQFLTARSTKIQESDDMSLAFSTRLEELAELASGGDEVDVRSVSSAGNVAGNGNGSEGDDDERPTAPKAPAKAPSKRGPAPKAPASEHKDDENSTAV